MHTSRTLSGRPAFTIIEVLVATTIIGIIAASAGLSFLKTRLNARNGQRKEVAQTYTKAIGSYAASTGTSFITASASKTNCTTPVGSPSSSSTNLAVNFSGPDCVGADGRGFGMLNYIGSTNVSSNTISSALSSLLGTNGFSYDNSSNDTILQALQKLGYLGTISTDPLVKLVHDTHRGPSGADTIPSTAQDYLLVRCCKDGRQAIGSGGSLYAVWAKLETGGSASIGTATDANSQYLCGGPAVAPPTYGPPTGPPGSSTNNYHFAFGGTVTPVSAVVGDVDQYDPSWFAVGNAPVQNLTSMNDSCEKGA